MARKTATRVVGVVVVMAVGGAAVVAAVVGAVREWIQQLHGVLKSHRRY